MSKTIRRVAVGAVTASLLASAAHAGGFNRGSANLEGLYGEGFGVYSGATFIAPSRTYEAGTSVDLGGGNITTTTQSDTFTDSYVVPYGSVGGNIAGYTNCVASFAVPYGANSTYSDPVLRWDIAAQNLDTTELGLTCSQGFSVGPGMLRIIGGVFHETGVYDQAQDFTAEGSTDLLLQGLSMAALAPYGSFSGASTLELKSTAYGYRFGIGYEIPEIALRGEIMYRSATHHNWTGTYSNVPFQGLAILGGTDAGVAAALYDTDTEATASAGSQSLPQSVTMNLRSGVAPGTLVFGSVKWTDWSVLQQISVVEGIAGQDFSTADFFFTDGWTVTAGAARQFNDMFAGSLSLTWDKGVTTGYDSLSDTWTVASGVRAQKNNMTFSLGGAAIYFTEANKTEGDIVTVVPGEWGYALSAGASGVF